MQDWKELSRVVGASNERLKIKVINTLIIVKRNKFSRMQEWQV